MTKDEIKRGTRPFASVEGSYQKTVEPACMSSMGGSDGCFLKGENKLKKFFTVLFAFIMSISLLSCSGDSDTPKVLEKEGIMPYQLSESDTYLLRSFNMEGTSQLISFHAPQDAKSLMINICRLKKDHTWEKSSGGGIGLGTAEESDHPFSGTFTMLLHPDHSIDLHINSNGIASYRTDAVNPDKKYSASVRTFLTDYQPIELDKEIPVAIMVYSDRTEMRSHGLNDFFSPDKFNEDDLVEVVTLTFSGQKVNGA